MLCEDIFNAMCFNVVVGKQDHSTAKTRYAGLSGPPLSHKVRGFRIPWWERIGVGGRLIRWCVVYEVAACWRRRGLFDVYNAVDDCRGRWRGRLLGRLRENEASRDGRWRG